MYSSNSKIAIGFACICIPPGACDIIAGDLGVRGVRGLLPGCANPAEPGGCGGPISSATEGPKTWDNVAMSGGGIGYIPKLISSKDKPRDHKSLATEY